MARVSVKNEKQEELDDNSQSAERMADLNEAEGGDLYRAIDEARSTAGVEVILTRTMPADKAGFCDKIPVAEFDLSMLKAKYGAGTYRVRFNGPTGFLPGGGTVKIAPTPEISQAAAGPSNMFDFFNLQDRIRKEDSEKRARLLELAIPALGTALAAWIARPMQNNQPDLTTLVTALKGPSLSDLSTAMVNFKTLSGPEKSESQVDTILKVFESARDLMGGKDSDGKSGEGSNWVDVIRDLIKVAPDAIKPVLEARMAAMQAGVKVQQPAIAPNQSVPLPQSLPATPIINTSENQSAASATNGGGDMRALWEPIAKQHLSKVLSWAQKNRDPEIYAEVFVDELPDLAAYLTVDQVLEHLANPQWFEKVSEIVPQLSVHREYCDEMRLAVIEIVKEIKEEAQKENLPLAMVDDTSTGAES